MLSALLATACAARLVLAAPAGEPFRFETRHYRVAWDGPRAEAEECGLLLEQAWDELATFFGARPREDEPLAVRVFADEDARRRGVWADGDTVPAHNRGASFSQATRALYVARAPRPADTRNALLYGACLQFHALCKSKNLDIGRTWYAEGIAHDFARSTWDRRRLVPFAGLRVDPRDLPGQALQRLGSDEDALPELREGDGLDPVLAWGVAALAHRGAGGRYRAIFQRSALGDTGSKLSGADFLRTLGSRKRIARDLRAFLTESRAPFETEGDWEDRGAAGIVGRADLHAFASCVLRAGVERLAARIEPRPSVSGSLGFVVGWAGPEDCAIVRLGGSTVRVDVLRLGRTQSAETYRLPAAAGDERRIEIARSGSQYQLSIDGNPMAPLELPSGRMGFFVEGLEAAFHDVRWR